MTPYGMEYPFGQLGSAVLAVSHHRSLCTPNLLTGGLVWGVERSLTWCKHCSAATEMSVCYQHCSPKSKPLEPSTVPATKKKINSIPAKTRKISTPYSIPSTSCPGPTLSNTSQLITTMFPVLISAHRYLSQWAITLKCT